MDEGAFTGKFQKTVEAFAVQRLDSTDLNRLTSDLLLWVIVLTAAFLAIHFVFSALPGLARSKGALTGEGM